MKRFLLDTAPLTSYLLGRPGAVALIDPWIETRQAATSILVYAEIHEYLMGRSDLEARDLQLRKLLQALTPYLLSYATLRRYASLRRRLRPPHGPGLIGDIDTLIAATALERDLTLVTTDRDYERVPSLDVMLVTREALVSQ